MLNTKLFFNKLLYKRDCLKNRFCFLLILLVTVFLLLIFLLKIRFSIKTIKFILASMLYTTF